MDPSSPPQESHVISQQVFGSSKKLQFIGISPMDSLLRVIDHQTQQTKSTQQTMSIESLLDSNGETPNKRRYPTEDTIKMARRKVTHSANSSSTTSTATTASGSATASEVPAAPAPVLTVSASSVSPNNYLKTSQMTTITCYHASVAQKSYGSEKRFLCPPPVVRFQSASPTTSPLQLTMSVINENGDKPLEQHAVLDDDQCTFKYLHVTGTAKAKQFSLRVNITSNNINNANAEQEQPPSYASFLSNPISIISKPSKKAAKARNVSTCILTSQPVSLFNRINSQTVRTKYMTSDNNQLCAKNSTWSPFEVLVLSQPQQYQATQRPSSTSSSNNNNNASSSSSSSNVQPLIYGSELILRDSRTGVRSQPLIIRKVDKGRIVPGAFGPVSQMQKIALQLVTSSHRQAVYLSAVGATEASETGVTPAHSPHASFLDYSPSRMVPDGLDAYEKVDDYLCWTIVGISTFEYSFYDHHTPSELSSMTSSTTTAALPSPSPSSSSSTLSSCSFSSPSPSSSSKTVTTPISSPTLSSPAVSSSALSIRQYRPEQHLHESSSSPSSSSSSSSSLSSLSSLSSSASHDLLLPSPPSSSPTRCITPFPVLTSIQYKPLSHQLDIIGQHLMQAVPSPKLLEFWLGSHHGPLHTTVQPQPQYPHRTHLLVDVPSTQDLIVANHDRLVSNGTSRTLELPLFLVREDGVVYHSGKALVCEMLVNSDTGRFSTVDVRQ